MHVLEWVVLAVGALAVCLTYYIRRLAVCDHRRSLDEQWSYAAVLVSESNVRAETVNLALASVCGAGAMTSVLTPPPPGEFDPHSILQVAFLALIATLVILQGTRTWYYRSRILSLPYVRYGPTEEEPCK